MILAFLLVWHLVFTARTAFVICIPIQNTYLLNHLLAYLQRSSGKFAGVS